MRQRLRNLAAAPPRAGLPRRLARGLAVALVAIGLVAAGPVAVGPIAVGPRPASAQNAPSFGGLGDLPGGPVNSRAIAVSADGGTVVGYGENAAGLEAVRWTSGGGLTGLGQPSAPTPFSQATSVSADGSVVAGTAATNSGSRAFRWSGSYTILDSYGCFLCDPTATGFGISPDGLVVVGSGLHVPFIGDPVVNATRWPGGGTGESDLGDLPGPADASAAQDADQTGAVIVGEADSSAGPAAFVWTAGGGMTGLPGLPGALPTEGALAISADATTIVGYANASASGTNQAEPVAWTGAGWGTITNLGALPGLAAARGKALDVTGDGVIVVGTTRDAAAQDVAFLWDAANGLRSLATELEEEYGLDLGDWRLLAAHGVSDVDAQGQLTIVGRGVNPAGQEEGFVAFLSPTACNDGLDNDGDGLADFGSDPECIAKGDRSETADCADGLDNDGDGQVDAADGECRDAADLSEVPDCADGFDNDGGGDADFPADPGCRSADWPEEAPECQNGLDDDGDGNVDAADAQCLALSDRSERNDCENGADDDGDGLADGADPDCTAPDDPAEEPACSDLVDNDGDGRLDFPDAHPRCLAASDPSEAPQCGDGEDDDGDGDVDFPDDAECGGPLFDVEAPGAVAAGELLLVDRGADALYAIDPATGTRRLLSQGARLADPQGVAGRADGRIAVSTPDGLVEVSPITGAQTPRSAPFSAFDGMPFAFDSNGDAIVLDSTGIHRVAWDPAGVGPTTTLFTVPTPEDPPELIFVIGSSFALGDDTAYLGGFGSLGDGVFEVDLGTLAITPLMPGFTSHVWRGLAVEDASTLLAAGKHFSLGEGVYRVDRATGTIATLSDDPAWVRPDSIAVAASGDLYVADSGTCDADLACTGGEVVHLDPATGARTLVNADPYAGPLELGRVLAVAAVCDDGVDNDGDGLSDHGEDPGCVSPSDPAESQLGLPCDDNIDNDGDGARDFPADIGCKDHLWDREAPKCQNGLDDDGDGKIDWAGGPGGEPADPQCAGKPYKDKERRSGGCGLGAELALALPALLWLRDRARGRPARSARS